MKKLEASPALVALLAKYQELDAIMDVCAQRAIKAD